MFHNEKEDVRVRYTREWTFEALEQCLKQYTLKELTISKVIEKSGISRATFYRHFDSIEDVVKQRIDVFFKRFYDEMIVYYETEHPNDERALIAAFFERINDKHELIDVVIKMKLDYMMVNGIYTIIMYMKRQFYPTLSKSKISEQYTMEMVASSAWTLLSRWHRRGKVESGKTLADIFEQAFKQVASALFENRRITDVSV
jgi:AcrR family transcriptional regulator